VNHRGRSQRRTVEKKKAGSPELAWDSVPKLLEKITGRAVFSFLSLLLLFFFFLAARLQAAQNGMGSCTSRTITRLVCDRDILKAGGGRSLKLLNPDRRRAASRPPAGKHRRIRIRHTWVICKNEKRKKTKRTRAAVSGRGRRVSSGFTKFFGEGEGSRIAGRDPVDRCGSPSGLQVDLPRSSNRPGLLAADGPVTFQPCLAGHTPSSLAPESPPQTRSFKLNEYTELIADPNIAGAELSDVSRALRSFDLVPPEAARGSRSEDRRGTRTQLSRHFGGLFDEIRRRLQMHIGLNAS